MEELSPAECSELLASNNFGRLATMVDHRPEIFPVNYAFSGETVVFRTSAGTKLAGAAFGRVAFEIDGVEPGSHTGWSVVVHGVSTEINGALDASSVALRQLELAPWAPGEKLHWVAIRPESVTGRRLRRA